MVSSRAEDIIASASPWRAFGQPADIDLDFADMRRSNVVTRVLAGCRSEPVSDDAPLWQLTLSGRIGGLAAIVELTEECDILAAGVHCRDVACAQPFEIEIHASTLVTLGEEAERERSFDSGTAGLRLRRPTGDDQRRWQSRLYADADEAAHVLLSSLVMNPPSAIDASTLTHLDACLAQHDPLMSFTAIASCPACGREQEIALDLEALLLTHLARRQRALVRDVHRLAARYGWCESDILALPAWRRRAYLEHIDAELFR